MKSTLKTKHRWPLYLFLIGCLLFCLQLNLLIEAARADLFVDVNITSWHKDSHWNDKWSEPKDPKRGYNQKNFGMGLTWEPFENHEYFDIRGGFYENSFYKNSVYGGVGLKKRWTSKQDFNFAIGIALGLVTGYDNTPREGKISHLDSKYVDGLYPLALPYISFGYKDIFLNVGVVPSEIFSDDTETFITGQLQFRVID